MQDSLKQLLQLQEIDKRIDESNLQLKELPKKIEEKRSEIQTNKEHQEQEKNKLVNLQLGRKNKEIELASQEEKIKKHEAELNSIKSNEAYRALLNEISAAKQLQGKIEDEILTAMEEIDRTSKEIKKSDLENKATEQRLQSEIQQIEDEIKKVLSEVESETKKREEFSGAVPKDLLSKYNYIRDRKKTVAIVAISGECCTGCNTNLTPGVVNEVKKSKELVLCDSCSRILYVPETSNSVTTSS